MSGLLAGLALRGAGLDPPGKPLLAPRGRARFEPMGGVTDGDVGEAAFVPVAEVDTPPSHVPPPSATQPLATISRAEVAPPVAAPPIRVQRIDRDVPPVPPSQPPATIALPSAVVPAPVVSLSEPPQVVFPAAAPSADSAAPESGLVADAPRTTPFVEPRSTPRNAVRMLLDHLASNNEPGEPRTPDRSGVDKDSVGTSAPVSAAAEPPRVTVSIDRIQVVVEAPPSRAAPIMHPTTQAIGFASYARIRRGMPR
jgi:hypothetical protein